MAEGSTTCSLCDAGKFTNDVSSSVCMQCNEGFISTGGLVTECTGCAPGKAAATRGSAVCVTCNEGWFSKANESECFICPLRGVKCSEGVLVVEDGCVTQLASLRSPPPLSLYATHFATFHYSVDSDTLTL